MTKEERGKLVQQMENLKLLFEFHTGNRVIKGDPEFEQYINDILDMILDEMTNELVKGNDVKLSSFGTFALRNKKARAGRNPKTGVEAVISPRRVISFKPSQTMRKIINA